MPTACDVRKCPCARSAVAPRRSDGYCWQETSGPWTLNLLLLLLLLRLLHLLLLLLLLLLRLLDLLL